MFVCYCACRFQFHSFTIGSWCLQCQSGLNCCLICWRWFSYSTLILLINTIQWWICHFCLLIYEPAFILNLHHLPMVTCDFCSTIKAHESDDGTPSDSGSCASEHSVHCCVPDLSVLFFLRIGSWNCDDSGWKVDPNFLITFSSFKI
jgi:hypothetical protein